MTLSKAENAPSAKKRLRFSGRLAGYREKFVGGGVVRIVSFAGEVHVLRGVAVGAGVDACVVGYIRRFLSSAVSPAPRRPAPGLTA